MANVDEPEFRQVAIRLPASYLERVEKHVVRMRAASPGVDVKRADAIRSLLALALEHVEQQDQTEKA